jgi:NADH:ubiquinone oxidoreductase subunit 6 (subunit J)
VRYVAPMLSQRKMRIRGSEAPSSPNKDCNQMSSSEVFARALYSDYVLDLDITSVSLSSN